MEALIFSLSQLLQQKCPSFTITGQSEKCAFFATPFPLGMAGQRYIENDFCKEIDGNSQKI